MYEVVHRGERLVTISLSGLNTPAEISELGRQLQTAYDVVGATVLLATDMRTAKDHSDKSRMDAYERMMRSNNPRILRSGILVSLASSVALQVYNIVVETASPNRRVFRREEDMVHWFEEVMTPNERAALVKYLEAGRP